MDSNKTSACYSLTKIMELRTWIERLEPLKAGETTPLLPEDSVQSVYSAIKDHPTKLAGRKYRVSKKKGVVGRIK